MNDISVSHSRLSTSFLLVSALFALLVIASPAQAIYNGAYTHFAPVGSIAKFMNLGGHPEYYNICSGTLIASRLVLTAGSCFDGIQPHDASGLRFYVLKPGTGRGVTAFQATDFHVFGRVNATNDVGLLMLSDPVPYHVAAPVSIANTDFIALGTTARAFGWGETCRGCNDASDQRGNVLHFIGSRDSFVCSGDTGGPILSEDSFGRSRGFFVMSGVSEYCGDEDRVELFGEPSRYYIDIRRLTALWGGAPYCAASVSPTTGVAATIYNAVVGVVGDSTAGAMSCTYSLDGEDPVRMASCSTVLAFKGQDPNPLSPMSLGAGTHSLLFTVDNANGTDFCQTAPFSVTIPGTGSITINPPQATNVEPGDSKTFTASLLGGTGIPTYSWTITTVAVADARDWRSVFAGLPARMNQVGSVLWGFLERKFVL